MGSISQEGIVFKNIKVFEPEALQSLFLSVQWQSGHYPDQLAAAMRNSGTVFSAWDNEKLIGLINVLDDGSMTAYVHYLLVEPAYQGNGIGKELMRLVLEKYKFYLRILLVAESKEIEFYQHCGFKTGTGMTPMFLDSFTTQY